MDNYNVIYESLPNKVKGFIMYDSVDDYYMVVLNINLDYCSNKETFDHEIQHIINDDFHSCRDVNLLESILH